MWYVFGCNISLFVFCGIDFGITPVDDITVGITWAAFCFHIARISLASSWHLFCLLVIVYYYYYYYYCCCCCSANMLHILRGNLYNLQSLGVALGGNGERVCYLGSDTRNAVLEVWKCDDFRVKSEAESVGKSWLQNFEFLLLIVAWCGILFVVNAVGKPLNL